MKTYLSNLIMLLCEEIQKSRNYVEQQADASPYINIDEAELSLPLIFYQKKDKRSLKELEKVKTPYLSLEIPFNYEKSILKQDLLDKEKLQMLRGRRVICEIPDPKEKIEHPATIGNLKIKFKLFPKLD